MVSTIKQKKARVVASVQRHHLGVLHVDRRLDIKARLSRKRDRRCFATCDDLICDERFPAENGPHGYTAEAWYFGDNVSISINAALEEIAADGKQPGDPLALIDLALSHPTPELLKCMPLVASGRVAKRLTRYEGEHSYIAALAMDGSVRDIVPFYITPEKASDPLTCGAGWWHLVLAPLK